MSGAVLRTRWAAIGAACAVSLGAGGLLTASAATGTGERAVFVSITPCRIMDTRPGSDNRGPRTAPLGSGDTYTIPVFGTNGDCTVPADAVAVSLNVTSLNATSDSFLTIFPAGATRPTASSLNWRAGQAPTPNAVVADLPVDGQLSFFNLAGSVDVIADVNGYYVDHHHDDRYYTKAEVYTKAEADAALASKVSRPTGEWQVIVGPASFVHDGAGSNTWIASFGAGLILGQTGTSCFQAAITLPDGATVTSFAIRLADNSTSSMLAELIEDPFGAALATAIAEINSVGQSATEQTATDTSLTSPDVDAANNLYAVTMCLSSAMQFYGAKVTFTYP